MDDENRRGREYYQVNLDTGRIFWIAFVLGLVLIGIFIFGFLVGGEDRGKPLGLGRLELFDREEEPGSRQPPEAAGGDARDAAGGEESAGDGGLSGLFRTDLEAETRYIEVESIEKAVRESERLEPSDHREPGKDRLPAGEYDRPEPPAPGRREPPKKPAPAPRAEGIYYIQVGSFTREENARAFAERLRKNLYKVIIEEAVVDGTAYHRVRVGPFEQRSVAVNTMTAMKRRFNLDSPFVVAKRS
jgi:cell division septation protein DedD